MCFKLSELVYSCRAKISPTRKNILAYLGFRFNEKTGRCNPSLRRMELDLGYTKANLILNLRWLEENGWITISKSENLTNQYDLNIEKFTVDKPVDNPVNENMGSIAAIPGGSIAAIPEVVSQQYQNNHINNNLLNNNNDWEAKICEQVQLAHSVLKVMGWYKNQRVRYINFFGAERILSEAKKVNELCKAGKITANKMGAYLRKVLNNIDNRVQCRKAGGRYE